MLGLTSGANATLAVTLAFMPGITYIGIMIACFIGAALGALLVVGIGAAKRGGFSPLRLVLAGVAVSVFLRAIAEAIGISFKLSKHISMWTAGGLIGASWKQLQAVGPVLAVGILAALLLSSQLTVLSLSDETAAGLGQRVTGVKLVLFAITIVLAGIAVALVGDIAFLGLIVPHVVRSVVGPDYRYIVPLSAVCGGILLLLVDLIARTIHIPYETPAVAILAVIGLPFFLWIARGKGGQASL